MIDGLKPYPKYKDSGLKWLGRIPGHWGVRRLKQVCRFAYGDSLSKDVRQSGEIPVYGSNGCVGFHNKMNTHAPCLVIGRKGSFGKVNYSSAPVFAIDTTFYVDDRTTPNNLRWLFYVLGWVALDAVSKDSAVPGLDRGDAYDRVLPYLTDFDEQTAIARFLDHVNRRIERYIRAKKKLIALLNEQKQVIIHRAVTRGFDTNVRLKSSGVEWLAQTPEHWEIRRNGQLFVQRNQTGFAELPILEVSLKTGVRIRNLDNSTRKQVMSDRTKYKRAVRGDIAYNMMRMWQGAVGVCAVDGLVSPAYVVARPLHSIESRYYASLFRTTAYMGEVDSYSRGIVKDRNRLYWEDFKRMASPYPPPDEQVRIADAIEENTGTINDAIAQAYHEIDLIREYRTRLVADVVTGQLDVREAAAKLPEEPSELQPIDDGETSIESEEALNDSDLEAETVEEHV
jgi:type I restriction enzyme S subunit